MKVLHLKKLAPKTTQRTPKEALEEAVGMLKDDNFEAQDALVIIFDGNAEYSCYRYIYGGNMSRAEMLWHLAQMQAAILEDRIG